MVVDDVDAWSPKLRSRSQLVETPKRHLVDPSLAAALMRKFGGGHSIDAAAGSLLKLAEDRVAKPPQALLVVTGGQYCYRRKDDVHVVPLGCLGP